MNLIDNYYKWLKEKITLTKTKDWVEITTPCIGRHNDYIQIYIKKSKAFVVTNDIAKTINSDFLDALKHYDIEPILWSDREHFKEILSA